MDNFFDDNGNLNMDFFSDKEPKKELKAPSKELVNRIMKATGKSERKCYFWALEKTNQEVN